MAASRSAAHLRKQLDRLDGLPLQIDEPRLDLGRAQIGLGDLHHARDKERPAGEIFGDLKPLLALADEMVRAVRRGDVARDVGDRAHAMHVDRRGVGDIGGTLHEDADLALVAHRLLRRRDRLLQPAAPRTSASM